MFIFFVGGAFIAGMVWVGLITHRVLSQQKELEFLKGCVQDLENAVYDYEEKY